MKISSQWFEYSLDYWNVLFKQNEREEKRREEPAKAYINYILLLTNIEEINDGEKPHLIKI